MRIAAHEVVFHQPGAAEAELIGQGDFIQPIRNRLGFGARKLRRHGEFKEKIDTHGRSGEGEPL